jgi:methyltransferase (TIGR00027 family)
MARLDVITVRVAAIDAELGDAVAAGCRQLVILGAGLDTRAFRLGSLAGLDVFEVDHPATQEYKQGKTSSLRPLSKSLVFVPVDFEGGSLGDSLVKAGFRPGLQTVFIWEGVVMYLTDQAVRRTLDEIAGCSSPGSVLIVSYHEEDQAEDDPRELRLRRLLLSLWREPHIGRRSREAMRREVMRVGFDVAGDSSLSEWAHRLRANEPFGQAARVSRVLVAKRNQR